MLATYFIQRENELFDELKKEKGLFRKLLKVVELNAVVTAFKETVER